MVAAAVVAYRMRIKISENSYFCVRSHIFLVCNATEEPKLPLESYNIQDYDYVNA